MHDLQIEEWEVFSPRLSSTLNGLRILQISDVHICRRFLRKQKGVAQQIARLSPDVVVLTGDVVNHPRYWEQASRWLADLPLAASVPRLAVPGNWDYRCGGAGPFRRCMQAGCFDALINESRSVATGKGTLQVAGFDDLRFGRFRPRNALADLDPGKFVLALSHTPDLILHLDTDKFDLMLSGHTHGGQIRLPKFGAVITSTRIGRPFAHGLQELGPNRYLYVSRGLGAGKIPWRVLCPPELALFTLTTILGDK